MSGAVESKKHFILECDAFKDIRESYGNMLASVSCHCLFSEGIVGRLGQLKLGNEQTVYLDDLRAKVSIYTYGITRALDLIFDSPYVEAHALASGEARRVRHAEDRSPVARGCR